MLQERSQGLIARMDVPAGRGADQKRAKGKTVLRVGAPKIHCVVGGQVVV